MARKTIEQRLAELDAQRATLKARLSKQERANDTRRKVLLGALVVVALIGCVLAVLGTGRLREKVLAQTGRAKD